MSRKDYVQLADIIGRTLGAAWHHGGEDARTAVYGELYDGTVALLASDNPAFDRHRFSFAVGKAEQSYAMDRAETRHNVQ